VLQRRVHLGGALSGRDIEAVSKTVSGLVKLLFPDPDMPVQDEDLEAIVRLALEARRRVKEQQKRCLKSEFRNTYFSYTLGTEGVEQFVSTPELHSDEAIESDPLPPGQVWAISPGTTEAGAGLYRIEVNAGPGNGVRILNKGKSSKSDILRKAIALFDVAAQAKQKDQRVGILDRDDKVVKEIVGI
jgi:ATP-dependent Lon protease